LCLQLQWDYGRLALVNSATGKRWTQIFYAHGNNQEILNSLSSEMSTNDDHTIQGERGDSTNVHVMRQQSVIDSGFFSWIVATYKLRKEQILRHSGPDACHYLSFQQHLIIVMAIISFVSLVIILPINFQVLAYQ
jgi:calcium permeable stress-gated cation channel